jgi:hypothetical protein
MWTPNGVAALVDGFDQFYLRYPDLYVGPYLDRVEASFRIKYIVPSVNPRLIQFELTDEGIQISPIRIDKVTLSLGGFDGLYLSSEPDPDGAILAYIPEDKLRGTINLWDYQLIRVLPLPLPERISLLSSS